jgi:Fe-S-cluster containining protein
MEQAPMPSGRHAVRHKTQTALRTERTAAAMLHLVDETARQATTDMVQAFGGKRPDCAAGCVFCCYHPVDITVPEGLGMMHYLRTTLPPAELATRHARVAEQAAKVRDLSFEAHAQAKVPCALLVNGTCSVYPARPFACRAWHSMSVARCETIFVEGDPLAMIPPLDTEAYTAVWDVARGFAEGCQRARLDGRSYELHSLLLRALETPEAAKRWMQGDDVFAGCTVGAFTT